jgi:hypothetical protein
MHQALAALRRGTCDFDPIRHPAGPDLDQLCRGGANGLKQQANA